MLMRLTNRPHIVSLHTSDDEDRLVDLTAILSLCGEGQAVSQGQSDSGRAYRVRLHHPCRWSLGPPTLRLAPPLMPMAVAANRWRGA